MALLPHTLHREIENDVSPDHPKEGTNPSGEKRMTVPSLSALAILLKEKGKDNIFFLGVDEICRRLYSGFLRYRWKDTEKDIIEQKFWVCDKLGKNCVLVLSKTMDIAWAEDIKYWDYIHEKENCFDGEMDIPVARLKGVVTWLDVRGKFQTMVLSPKTTYKVAFVVKMSRDTSGWYNPVSVNLYLPDESRQECTVNLRNRPKEEWFLIPLGKFVTSPKNVGEMSFQLKETEGGKTGLHIKGVLLQPLD